MFAAVLVVGCAGPEKKLGRGIANVTEPVRMGELRRSMEQNALANGPDVSYTRGFIEGVNRTVGRTAVGVYEIITFPFPNTGENGYDAVLYPANPVYPDSYKPRILADPMYSPDADLGFSGGDVAPWVPGSRFRIFD